MKRPATLPHALQVVMRMGYVPDLSNTFIYRGEPHSLLVEDNVVIVRNPRESIPWEDFLKHMRPQ